MFGSPQTICWNQSPTATPTPPGKSTRRDRPRGSVGIQGRYESAYTHDNNTKHWALADFLSARAANSKMVRRTLRMRARYEAQNNPTFCGMVNTLGNDVVGKGPTLQALTTNDRWNEILEQRWREWFTAVRLAERLRVCVKSKVVDGEVFLLKKTDPTLDAVTLYPLEIECDQVTTIRPEFQTGYWVDGMELDTLGKPTVFHILKRHPGDILDMKSPWDPLEMESVPARFVMHWFRKDRPGQVRGVPEITASLDLFAQLRRFDKAVLTAAEWAATQSAVLETDLPADSGDDTPLGSPWETWEMEAGMHTVLPAGYKLNQLDAKQPTATHKEFTGTMLGQGARPLDMPFNIATCNSAGYNFSSGRLDHLPYHRKIAIERQDIDTVILAPTFRDWYDEAIMIPGYLPDDMVLACPSADLVPHVFHWPAVDSIDPNKDALADAANLANGTTTRAQICGRNGDDWRDIRRQLAREAAFDIELAEEFDLPENWADGNRPNMPTPTDAEDGADETADSGKEPVAA